MQWAFSLHLQEEEIDADKMRMLSPMYTSLEVAAGGRVEMKK